MNVCLKYIHVYAVPSSQSPSFGIVRSRWIAFINARVVTAWRYILPRSKAGQGGERRDWVIGFEEMKI